MWKVEEERGKVFFRINPLPLDAGVMADGALMMALPYARGLETTRICLCRCDGVVVAVFVLTMGPGAYDDASQQPVYFFVLAAPPWRCPLLFKHNEEPNYANHSAIVLSYLR